jgi:RNA polymerase sigma-70 factor, ECF subfamily
VQGPNDIDDETLERYRAYLSLLAGSKVDPWLRQRVDASDLVQQTLLDALERRDQFRGSSEGEFLAWLRTILSNNLIEALRPGQTGRSTELFSRRRDLSVVSTH